MAHSTECQIPVADMLVSALPMLHLLLLFYSTGHAYRGLLHSVLG